MMMATMPSGLLGRMATMTSSSNDGNNGINGPMRNNAQRWETLHKDRLHTKENGVRLHAANLRVFVASLLRLGQGGPPQTHIRSLDRDSILMFCWMESI